MSKISPSHAISSELFTNALRSEAEFINQLRQTGRFLQLSRTFSSQQQAVKQPNAQQPGAPFTQPIAFSLNNHTNVTIPCVGVIAFEPVAQVNATDVKGKDVIYSCGIHGNETAPIEICDELVQKLLREELTVVHRVLVIFGNLPAMDIAQRFVEENMNRLFDGEHANPNVVSNAERVRAGELETAVQQFFEGAQQQFKNAQRERHHYDLHTAIRDSKNEKFAVYPFKPNQPHDPEQLRFLGACGVNTILLSEAPTTTFSYHSAKHFNACAFTVELGKVKPFGENDMSRFADAKHTIIEFVTNLAFSLPEYDSASYLVYKISQVINKTKNDFSLSFGDDTPNFTDFKRGELLAEESGAKYSAQVDGEAIVFPNANVALGQRALLTVIQTTI